MSKHISKLIEQGENQQLDFKFEISDSRKIARTLVAFANTDGGKLLIGVKDNGAIAGVRSDEEYFMLEAAANMYCKPEIRFQSKEWEINGKIVLEITVPKGTERPYMAGDKDGNWLAYVRVNDQNFLANRIILKVWERREKEKGTYLKFTSHEKMLLEFLEKHSDISLSQFRKLASISRYKAESILINLLSIDVLETVFNENGITYRIHQDFLPSLRQSWNDK